MGVKKAIRFSVPALFLSLAWAFRVDAQVKNPYAGDLKVSKQGESQFRSNCAFCHGLGARGGGRGPDLTRARKRHGNSDEEIFRNIHDGIPGTAMPPATAGGIGVGMTDDEIWQVVTYIRSVEKKPNAASGNAARGKDLFYGKAACGTCHIVNGKGGRLGPELTTMATSRSEEYFVDSLRNPSKRLAKGIWETMKDFPQEYETANVTAADGAKYQGVVLNEDAFTVQVLDTREVLHAWEKSSLKSYEKTRQSLMPAYDEKMLPEKDVQDLLAFLAASAGGGR